MQKSIAVAVVASALIIAAALAYHGRQLTKVSDRLGSLEQRSTDLDARLRQFSNELPGVVEQAGRKAGRQAVYGVVEEVTQMPLRWLRPAVGQEATNGFTPSVAPANYTGSPADPGVPLVRFDLPYMTINIDIRGRLPLPEPPGQGRHLTSAPADPAGPLPEASRRPAQTE